MQDDLRNMRKVVVPNGFLSLAEDELRAGRSVRLHIDGESMYPFIRGGVDEVEIVPCPAEGELPLWCCPFYKWEEQYMVHRYIGSEGGECVMLGDGNIFRRERVRREEIIGILNRIFHPDGSVQDCNDPRWIRRGRLWYRLLPLRRFLIPAFRLLRI